MDWIKKHTDQFALAVAALLLLALSGFLLLKTTQFGDTFSAVLAEPTRTDKLPAQDLGKIRAAQQQFEKPALWTPAKEDASLFVANRYKKDESGNLIKIGMGPLEQWLEAHDFDILSTAVLDEDPDKDGFSNLVEFHGPDRNDANGDADSTNPRDGKSFPPYHVQLWLKQWIKVPFRLMFNAINGDPQKDKKETLYFQINTIDLRQPSEFLKLGEMVPNTKFKLVDFQYKAQRNESIGEDANVSELTLENDLGERVILVYDKVTDSPDSFALFQYLWPQPLQEIRVKKLGEFALKPELNKRYKLIDIKEGEALIQLPSGEKVVIPIKK